MSGYHDDEEEYEPYEEDEEYDAYEEDELAARGGAVQIAPRAFSLGSDGEDEEDETVRVEACLCLLDPFAGEASPKDAWPESAGGYTVLLTADEELCTVEPRANALSVLGVPDGATTFVKYVTADAPGTRFDVVVRANMA